jgi:hypothetical protein
MSSVSVDTEDSDIIRDPLADGFVDQPQQERGGGGLNLAVETEILGSEVGTEDPIINSGAIGEEGGLGSIPKGRFIAHNIFDNQNAVFLSFAVARTPNMMNSARLHKVFQNFVVHGKYIYI